MKNRICRYSKIQEDNHMIKTFQNHSALFLECCEVLHISITLKSNKSLFAFYQRLSNDITELNILIMQDSFFDTKWLEMVPKDCSKYRAIKWLADFLKIANDEIVVFGDGLNDMGMIEKCGYGVALKNVLPEVKEVADDITDYDYNHEGVIRYLDNLFINSEENGSITSSKKVGED